MIITDFAINNQGPLSIKLPNEKNIQLSLSITWNDVVLNSADAEITYSVEGNNSNIVFDNKEKKLVIIHKSILKDDTIHELLTFSISGNNQHPDDQFSLKVSAKMGGSVTSDSITISIQQDNA
ncbi:MAG TPA: hypothetical protein VNY73_00775 [Bacteroidia bacterium]|jgi:hypothetical protein|nr:hypothetical protein [Bacteroidia bacterium]